MQWSLWLLADRAERHDYEYRRCGVCNVFMATEPLVGQRMTKVTERRTKIDWAHFLDDIAVRYASARKITLVMDNLNTHRPGALYEAYPPARAKALWDRFEFVYTPKHGSWLNVAEVELNVMIGQCLRRRIDSIAVLREEVAAWQISRDRLQAKVNWQFTTDHARGKLKRLYPTLTYDMTLAARDINRKCEVTWITEPPLLSGTEIHVFESGSAAAERVRNLNSILTKYETETEIGTWVRACIGVAVIIGSGLFMLELMTNLTEPMIESTILRGLINGGTAVGTMWVGTIVAKRVDKSVEIEIGGGKKRAEFNRWFRRTAIVLSITILLGYVA